MIWKGLEDARNERRRDWIWRWEGIGIGIGIGIEVGVGIYVVQVGWLVGWLVVETVGW